MNESAPQKPCVTCAEPISVAAKKCKHCDSYQDYRKHFTFSHSILSLLVALVSVLALSAPIFKSAFEPRDAYIEFVSATADKTFVYLLVSNKGNEAGTFNRADLFFMNDIDEIFVTELSVAEKQKGSIFFQPKESKLLKLTSKSAPKIVSKEDAPNAWGNSRYMLRGFYSTYDGIGGSEDVYSTNAAYQEFIDAVNSMIKQE